MAGTVHIGSSLEEIERSERAAWNGRQNDKPFVLVTQPSLFDSTRAPEGRHTAWAYCHVPQNSDFDMTSRIESQVESVAPGFGETILARSVRGPAELATAQCESGGWRHLRRGKQLDATFCPSDTPRIRHTVCRIVPLLVVHPARGRSPWNVRLSRCVCVRYLPADRPTGAQPHDTCSKFAESGLLHANAPRCIRHSHVFRNITT